MIDWARVGELRDEVGADDFEEVFELFLEEVEDVIMRLRTSPDPGQFAADFHFLRGSALSLGFAAFSDLCQDAEKIASDGGTPNVAGVLASYDISKSAFLAGLPEALLA